jgi:hypothetical protein
VAISIISDDLDESLVAITCACGRTLLSATAAGLVAQVAAHWRLLHPEPIVITPQEFVVRHAFAALETD